MKGYRLTDRLLHDGEAYEPGDTIMLADKAAEALRDAKVIEPDDEAADLGKLTVAALQALAKEEGVTIADNAKKAEIIAAIEAARAAKAN